jgi:anti-sigma factor RsiW
MMNIVFAMRCKWTNRRLQRYIDMDPAAKLSEDEITRVRAHIAECERCTSSVEDYTKMKSALHWLGDLKAPDEDSLSRLRSKIDQIAPLTRE